MGNLQLILLVFAFVLALIAAYGWGPPPWQLGWLALALFFLSLIFGGATRLFG